MLGTRRQPPKNNQQPAAGSLDALFADANVPTTEIQVSSSRSAPTSSSSQPARPAPTSTSAASSPARPTPAVQPTPAAAPQVAPRDDAEFARHVHELTNMGFTFEHATIALKRCSNKLPDAITFCLDHDDDTMQQFIEEDREISAIRDRNNAFMVANPNNGASAAASASASNAKPASKSVFKRMIGLKGKGKKPAVDASVDSSAPPAENPNFHDPVAEDDFLLTQRGASANLEGVPSFHVAPASSSASSSSSSAAPLPTPAMVVEPVRPTPAVPVASSATVHHLSPPVAPAAPAAARARTPTEEIPAAQDSFALAMAQVNRARNASAAPVPTPAAGAAAAPAPSLTVEPASAVIAPAKPPAKSPKPAAAAAPSAASQDPYALAMAQVARARAATVAAETAPVVAPSELEAAPVPLPARVATPPLQRSESPVLTSAAQAEVVPVRPPPPPAREAVQPAVVERAVPLVIEPVAVEEAVEDSPPAAPLVVEQTMLMVAPKTPAPASPVPVVQETVAEVPAREEVAAAQAVEQSEESAAETVDAAEVSAAAEAVVEAAIETAVESVSEPAPVRPYDPASELSEFGYDDAFHYKPSPTAAVSAASATSAGATSAVSRPLSSSSVLSVSSASDSAKVPVRVTSARPGEMLLNVSAYLGGVVSDLLEGSSAKSDQEFFDSVTKANASQIIVEEEEEEAAGESAAAEVAGVADSSSSATAMDDARVVSEAVEEAPVAVVEPSVAAVVEVESVAEEAAAAEEYVVVASEDVPVMAEEQEELPAAVETYEASEVVEAVAEFGAEPVTEVLSPETTGELAEEGEPEAEEEFFEARPVSSAVYGLNFNAGISAAHMSTASMTSVRSQAATIVTFPRRDGVIPTGGVATAFVGVVNNTSVASMQMETDTSMRSSVSRSSDDNEEREETDENTINTGDQEEGDRNRFETGSTDFHTNMSIDSFNSAVVHSNSNHNMSMRFTQPIPGVNGGGVSSSSSSPLVSPRVAVAPIAPPAVVHTPFYHHCRDFLSHVRKRHFLEFHVTQVDNKYKATISLKQTKLHKKENSPQGSRANLVTIGVCSTRDLANDLCLSLAPPEWTGKRDSTHCSACNVQFTMFTKKGHHCRNCGFIVCTSCSNKNWPSSMVPSTYHDSEKYIRVCNTCQTGTEMFIRALREGDYHAAVLLYDMANINLHYPFGIYVNNAYPVHCAAVGGSLELLKWLVDVKKCSISEKTTRKPLVYGRNNLSVLAVAAQAGHVDIMRYLVREKKCNVLEIAELSILQRALHMALEAPGPMPDYVPPKKKDNVEVLVGGVSSTSSTANGSSSSSSSAANGGLSSHGNASMVPTVVSAPSAPSPTAASQAAAAAAPRPPPAANRRTTMDNSVLVSTTAAVNRSTASDPGPARGPSPTAAASVPQVSRPFAQTAPSLAPNSLATAPFAPSAPAATAASNGIAARGVSTERSVNSLSHQSMTMESNVLAYYDQTPVHIAQSEVAMGSVFTATATVEGEDAPVAATAFLADDVVFAVADSTVRPHRQVSDRLVAVASPYVAGPHNRPAAPAAADPRAPIPELVVEQSLGRSGGNRWW